MPVHISSRDLVRRYLEGRPIERSPVVLHVGPYAARLQQMSYQQVAGDATLLANSLQSAQKLFGCDGLIVLADATLEAEACGCEVAWRDDEPVVTSHPLGGVEPGARSVLVEDIETRGRLAVTLEAAKRLAAVVGRDVALFPAVTGPVTLAAHLRGPSFWADLDASPERADETLGLAGQVMLRIARWYLDAGFEQILVSDPLLGRVDPAHYPRVAAVLRTLWNVAEFYDAHVLLQTEVNDDSRLEALRGLGAAGLVVERGGPTDSAERRDVGAERGLIFGLPSALVDSDPAALEGAVTAWRSGGCGPDGLVACCNIPRTAPPENVHAVIRLLRG